MFNFGAPKPAATSGTTGSSFFGASNSTGVFGGNSQAGSGFGSGAIGQSTNPSVNQQATPSSQSLVSSFSTHPFQYIQQCYDTNSLNYRFRVLECLGFFYNILDILL